MIIKTDSDLVRVLDSWIAQHRRATIAAIMIVALGVRIAIAMVAGFPNHIATDETASVALAIASGRGFADAYGPGTGPTAHVSPVYPLLLAGIYRVFGAGKAGAVAQYLFGFSQAAVICALMFPLARALRISSASACIGALLFALPSSWATETGEWYNGLAAICVVGMIILVEGLVQRDCWSRAEAAWAGWAAGIALMVTPSLVLWFGVLALIGLWKLDLRRFTRFLLMSGAVAIVTLLPWAIRNQMVLGSPIWSRSNLGLELFVSHMDGTRARAWDVYFTGPSVYRHPSTNETERRHLMQIGEVAYNREKLQMALSWAQGHPGQEASLLVSRIFHFWLPSVRNRLQMTWLVITTLLGFCGLVLWLCRASTKHRWITGTLLLTFPLVYYLVYTVIRYRYPLLPLLMLFAGDAVIWMFAWPRSREGSRQFGWQQVNELVQPGS